MSGRNKGEVAVSAAVGFTTNDLAPTRRRQTNMASNEEGGASVEETTMADDQVQVFLKLRPVTGEAKEEDGVLEVVDSKSVSIFNADKDEPTVYELDGVLETESSTNNHTAMVCGDLAERFVAGRDCTLMAYGPRQSGKTFSLFGNICAPAPKSGESKITKAENTKEPATNGTAPVPPKKRMSDDSESSDGSGSDSDDSDDSDIFRKKANKPKGDNEGMDLDDFGALDDLIQGALQGIPADDAAQEASQSSEAPQATTEGLAVSLCRQVFEELEKDASDILSLTMKLSVVEIYLDRMTDLLLPKVTGNDTYLKENPRGGATLIQGCAALSCVQPSDVADAIRRALQQRTQSQIEPFRDSHRSTVVVQIRLEQERRRQVNRSSVLQIVDLCASEFSHNTSSDAAQELDNSIAASILALQQEVKEPTPFSALGERPTLTRFLLPFCRAETVSRVLLMASKLDVGACQRSLDFGTACRQLPAIRLPAPETILPDCTANDEIIEREKRLTELVFAMAHECHRVAKNAKAPRHGPVWTAISEIQKLPHQHRPLSFYVETKREHEINAEKFAIRAELREAERKASTHKHLMKQFESDIQILSAQNEQLHKDLKERSSKLDESKHRSLELEQRLKEVEHNLRTSQFRESEAVVFLRQFRKFYYRLMRQIHGEDSSPGGSLVKQIAGAADLVQLIDLDKSMVESGLMEEEEIGRDVPLAKTYLPSRQALMRSVVAADATAQAVEADASNENGMTGDMESAVLLSGETETPSIVKRHETGEATEARQRIYKTPAGQYLSMREDSLEKELLALSEKCVNLQKELDEERATRKVLESTSPAVNKAKHAKELRTLKEQLTKRSNDLKAVIFKMNEIHAVSKTLQEKVADREQHVEYLEEELSSMQTKEANLLLTKEEAERSLRERIEMMENNMKANASPLWQLSEPGAVQPPPISSRISLSFAVNSSAHDTTGQKIERRTSVGEEDDWLGKLYEPRNRSALGSLGDDGPSGSEEFDALKEEVRRLKDQLKAGRGVEVDPLDMMGDVEQEESEASMREDATSSHHSVSDLLFMQDEVNGEKSPVRTRTSRRPSVYGNIVDAYKMQSSSDMSLEKDQLEASISSFVPPSLTSPKKSNSSYMPFTCPPRSSSFSQSFSRVTSTPTTPEGNRTFQRRSSVASGAGRWQPPRPKSADEASDGAVPEWMAKFKTIAARNHAESVIETSGSAEARELTRTSFGETLKHAHSTDNKDDGGTEVRTPKKWTPKKKNDDDSDSDDSFAKNFLAGASSHVVQPVGSDGNGHGHGGDGESSDESEFEQEKNVSKEKKSDNELEHEGGSYSYETSAQPMVAKESIQTAELMNSPPDNGESDHEPDADAPSENDTTPRKSFLDDSDSEDDESASEDEAKATSSLTHSKPSPVPVAPALMPSPAQSPVKKSFLDDSDSEDDSDEETESKSESPHVKELQAPVVASRIAAVGPTPSSRYKKSFLDDSDSDEGDDDESIAKPTPVARPPAPSLAPQKKSSFLDDSESDDDDSDEESKAESVRAPVTEPTKTVQKGKSSFLDDSESSDDSDEESQTVAQPPKLSSSLGQLSRTTIPDDNELESDDEEKDVEEVPGSALSTDKTPLQGDSDSSDDDSDEDDGQAAKSRGSREVHQTADSESDEESSHVPSQGGADDDESEEEVTERAGSGHLRRMVAESGDKSPSSRNAPITPTGRSALVDSQHDSEDETSSSNFEGGKPANATAIRGVPDFGAEVRSGIPTAPGTPKEKFAIKNGKLVKDSGHGTKSSSKKKKPKFSIVGGRLVPGGTGSSDKATEGPIATPPSTEGIDGIPATPSRRSSITAMVPAARTKPKSKSSSFAIKGGKLVKGGEDKPKQPAFSIMGGKLVKSEDAKKGKKKKSKKSDVAL